MSENQIVVYQPNETVRLDVRLENETVWLTQSQMALLFGCSADNIGLHLKNIYAIGELSRDSTTEDFSVVRMEGLRQVQRNVTHYNLDAIISVGYRVNTVLGVRFRQWATLAVKFCENFHDRFLILDDKEIYLIGASLKDLGKKCFGFTKMDASEIKEIKKRL